MPAEKIEPGDYVECVDAKGGMMFLARGLTYKVVQVYEGGHAGVTMLRLEGSDDPWRADRFKKVIEAPGLHG